MNDLESWMDSSRIRQLAEDLLTPREPVKTVSLPPKQEESDPPSILPKQPPARVSLSPQLAQRIQILTDWLKKHFQPSIIFLLNHEGKILYDNSEDQALYWLIREHSADLEHKGSSTINMESSRILQMISQVNGREKVTLAFVTDVALPSEHLEIVQDVLTQATTLE